MEGNRMGWFKDMRVHKRRRDASMAAAQAAGVSLTSVKTTRKDRENGRKLRTVERHLKDLTTLGLDWARVLAPVPAARTGAVPL